MFVVAIVNRKGGCGKSTLATHLATHLAQGEQASVLLADLDRQQSATAWLRLRDERPGADTTRLRGWATTARTLVRPQSGASHVVMDTPGGLDPMELARVVMASDVLLLPLRDSLFDRLATEQCLAELRRLPRVAQGRCKLAAVGLRLGQQRADEDDSLQRWAASQNLPLIGLVRSAPLYNRCLERGLTVFDHPGPRAREIDLPQWQPLLDWLAEAEQACSAASPARGDSLPLRSATPRAQASRSSRPASALPASGPSLSPRLSPLAAASVRPHAVPLSLLVAATASAAPLPELPPASAAEAPLCSAPAEAPQPVDTPRAADNSAPAGPAPSREPWPSWQPWRPKLWLAQAAEQG